MARWIRGAPSLFKWVMKIGMTLSSSRRAQRRTSPSSGVSHDRQTECEIEKEPRRRADIVDLGVHRVARRVLRQMVLPPHVPTSWIAPRVQSSDSLRDIAIMSSGDVTGWIAIALSLLALYQGWRSDKTVNRLLEDLKEARERESDRVDKFVDSLIADS